MAGAQVLPPFPIFTDVDGDPLDDGLIYVGQDLETPGSSVPSLFWDRDLTIPATSPISTRDGYPSNAGVRSRVYSSESTYSITVINKHGTIVYVSPSSLSQIGSGMVAAPGAGSVSQALGFVSVAQTGANGSGNETAEFISACALAIDQGHRRVFIPFPNFTVTDDTDGQQCEVFGSNTELTGHIRNTAALHNISEFGKNSDDRRIHPVSKTDFTPKLVKYISENYTQIFVQKKTKGYVLIDLKNNVTTAADSLAGSTSDITSHRVTAVSNCTDVIVGYKTAAASTGVWTATNLITGIEDVPPETGIQYQYLQGQAGTAGIYYEMSISVPQDGYFNVGFLRSAAAATDVTISVDGVSIDTSFTTVSATANLQIREYKALPGDRVVRVTKNLSGGLLNLLGCNFFKLKNARNDVSISHSGYYRAATTYRDYINSISANGYAIRDKDAEIWGGEYHGGEININEKLLADGNLVGLPIGGVQVCKSLKYIANFTIDYSAHGGSIIQCDKQHEFFGGGYNHEFSFTGNIRTESLFMTLFGVSTQMDKVLSPQRVDLAAQADETRVHFGRQNMVKYGCSTSDQTLTITHSMYTKEDNAKGGNYIYKVISSNYFKYYSGVVDRGDQIFSAASALNVIEVD